jgi:hypothetical protein
MGAMGLTLATIGGVFAATECMAGEFRGKKDYVNSLYGGVGAGLVLGARTGKPGVAVASAVCIGGVAALVDMTGEGNFFRGAVGLIEDAATPTRTYGYGSLPKSQE